MPIGNLLRDVQLMWNEIDSATHKSAHGRFSRAMEQIERAATKLKCRRSIETSSKQPLLRPLQAEAVAELCFSDLMIITNVSEQPFLFDDFLDHELLILLA